MKPKAERSSKMAIDQYCLLGLRGAYFLLILSFVATASAKDVSPTGEMRQAPIVGYLAQSELPDSLALLPPPPALGSAAEALDLDVARQALALRDSDRFKLAALDADLSFPDAAGAFSCALGAPITGQDTPILYRMLQRVMHDAGAATRAAKNKYQHARPFMLDGQPTCQPTAERDLRANGSYPSSHAAIGWAWAQALAEIAPDRAEALLERGRAFGDSRLVCNVHWASDVMEGRIIAAATVARLRSNPEFLADLQAAKGELAVVREKQLPPTRDCRFEAEALKQTPWLTP
jgi:acid phosphatase (class A)